MKTYCLDTNAILDVCYRFYPKATFTTLWESINNAIMARQIKFIITEHIYIEITNKINLMQYDMAVFDEFMMYFNVSMIKLGEYEEKLAQLKAELMGETSISPEHLNKLDNDLFSICTSILQDSTVITSEQGFNNNISTAKNIRNLKIPDVCRHCQRDCGNWLIVIEHIGFTT